MFSIMPRARSCRPRWATGRAVSQSGARIPEGSCLRDLEDPFDLDGGVGWQRRNADRGAGMTALVTERCDHQVGGAIEHLRSVQKVRRGIDKTTETNHAHD